VSVVARHDPASITSRHGINEARAPSRPSKLRAQIAQQTRRPRRRVEPLAEAPPISRETLAPRRLSAGETAFLYAEAHYEESNTSRIARVGGMASISTVAARSAIEPAVAARHYQDERPRLMSRSRAACARPHAQIETFRVGQESCARPWRGDARDARASRSSNGGSFGASRTETRCSTRSLAQSQRKCDLHAPKRSGYAPSSITLATHVEYAKRPSAYALLVAL